MKSTSLPLKNFSIANQKLKFLRGIGLPNIKKSWNTGIKAVSSMCCEKICFSLAEVVSSKKPTYQSCSKNDGISWYLWGFPSGLIWPTRDWPKGNTQKSCEIGVMVWCLLLSYTKFTKKLHPFDKFTEALRKWEYLYNIAT